MNKLVNLGWSLLCLVAPKIAVKIQYRRILGYKMNFRNPQDLNEKINYLKFHANLDEWAMLADKYAVREYVIKQGMGDFLVPLYGKYNNPKDLISDWNALPDNFVIKTNHGCGTVKLVTDKNNVNLAELEIQLRNWLKESYGLETGERHYLKIKPCLIVESLICEEGKQCPTDYKIWCFNGKPFCILAITGRDSERHMMYRSMYNLNWERIPNALPHNDTYTNETIPKPRNFEQMLKIAATLANKHKQVRVDLYNTSGKIYFGEMTFTSRGGYNNYNRALLLDMGSQFDV